MVFVSAFIFGAGVLAFATYNSILTQYVDKDEIGMGLGVMFACNSIIGIGAPFGFAVSYKYFLSINFEYGIFVIAWVLGFIGFLFSIPLKMSINRKRKEMDQRQREKSVINNSDTPNVVSSVTINTKRQDMDQPLLLDDQPKLF